MEKLDRIVPLPAAMQGRWLDSDDASTELVIAGGEVTYSGDTVDYEYKVITEEEGALTVTLGIENEALEDAFQRENVTGLVITPEGEFHAYNVKFASQFERVPERD